MIAKMPIDREYKELIRIRFRWRDVGAYFDNIANVVPIKIETTASWPP